MNTMNQVRTVNRIYRHIGGWALVLALTIGTGTGQAQVPVFWTNTTASGLWQDTTAWKANVPGATDRAYFTNLTTYSVTLNADASVGSITFSNNPSTAPTVTLDLGGNSLLATVADPVNAFLFDVADRGGTDTVYIASSTAAGKGLFLTNSAGNGKMTLGRNGTGFVFVTNGNVTVDAVVLGNGSSSQASKLVISGSSTYWTNKSSISIGNQAGSHYNSMVISNSAVMIVSGQLLVGAKGDNNNSLVLDSNAQLFTKAGATGIGAGGAGNNNTATVQGGATWDLGNKDIGIGVGGGSGNTLTIGANSTVVNISTATVFAANTLNLQGGLLQAAVVVSNFGFIKGSGSIVGLTVNKGTLSPGVGSSLGAVVFSNDLTLASGSTTLMKLDKSQLASNDFLNVFGTLTFGGTLTITNFDGGLVLGDTFKLFAFGGQSGDFSALSLPTLDPGLQWDTSQLSSQGTLNVVPEPSTLVLAGAGLGLVLAAFRRRRS